MKRGTWLLLLASCLLPSLSLFLSTVYEADPLNIHVLAHGTNNLRRMAWDMWGHHGRLVSMVWFAPLFRVLPEYPTASHWLSGWFLACWLLLCMALLAVFRRLLGSQRLSILLVLIFASQFHSWELRFWAGNEATISLTVQMLALPYFKKWTALSTFVALNIHQSGAMFPIIWLALEWDAVIAAGFAAGCAAYGMEVLWLVHIGVFVSRSNGEPLKNLGRFLIWFPRTVTALAPCLAYDFPHASWVLGLSPWFWLAWKRPQARYRAAAVWLGIVAAAAPVILTTGAYPSRTIACSVLGYWGGLLLLARPRVRPGLLAILAVMSLINLWEFGLLRSIKTDPAFHDARVHHIVDWGQLAEPVLTIPWGRDAYYKTENPRF